MNIENFTPQNGLTYHDLFTKQKELIFLYEPSEKSVFENFDIDCYSDQEEFKKYCWRVVEELTESLEAIDNNEENHIIEELIDGFNFLIELIILYGWSDEDLDFSRNEWNDNNIDTEKLQMHILYVIKNIGLSANCLKNRSWRQSQYLVDLYVFEKRLKKTFNDYYNLLRSFMTDDELLQKWSLKYQVNKFRINTKY